MGACVGKQQKEQNCIKQLNKISNELLTVRKTMFRCLNASDKMEKKLEKIDAKADIQLIQKYMAQNEGQYDYQSFINAFDILTQQIQRSKIIVETALKSYSSIKSNKIKNLIDSLNQYLSIFVLETSEGDEDPAVDYIENNGSPLSPHQEYQNNIQQYETQTKLPNVISAQYSLENQILRNQNNNINTNQQFQKPRLNSKSLGVPNTTTLLKEDQNMIITQRKRGTSTKTHLKSHNIDEYPQINVMDYSKNNSIINRQRMPSRQKSFTVFVVDGQIKIQQQQLPRVDLVTSDSQIG